MQTDQKEHQQFILACQKERLFFCSQIRKASTRNEILTTADSMLIMYDQLLERLKKEYSK